MTQKDMVIDYIVENGSITTLQAFRDLGITRLSARIDEIEKDGHEVHRERASFTNRYGKKVPCVRYWF